MDPLCFAGPLASSVLPYKVSPTICQRLSASAVPYSATYLPRAAHRSWSVGHVPRKMTSPRIFFCTFFFCSPPPTSVSRGYVSGDQSASHFTCGPGRTCESVDAQQLRGASAREPGAHTRGWRGQPSGGRSACSGVLALGGFQALRTGSDDDDPPRADSVMPARREEPSRCLSGFPPCAGHKTRR